jgi:hypothetical protein
MIPFRTMVQSRSFDGGHERPPRCTRSPHSCPPLVAMVTKCRDRELQMTCSPQRFRRLGKTVALIEHVACRLVCAHFRDGKYWELAVAHDDRHAMRKVSYAAVFTGRRSMTRPETRAGYAANLPKRIDIAITKCSRRRRRLGYSGQNTRQSAHAFCSAVILVGDHSPYPDHWWSCHLWLDKAGCCGSRTAAWLVSRLCHSGFLQRQSGSIGTPLGLPHRRADSRGSPSARTVHLQAGHTFARAGHELNAFEGLRDIFCAERFG